MNTAFYTGGPVWAYKGWVGNFYPPKTKAADYLKEYSQRLNTVEGNTTFYATPTLSTLQNWLEDTPDSFRFCPKIPRTISHSGALTPHIENAARFLDTMANLGERLGPIFLQLPPRYSPTNFDDLHNFLVAWPSWHPLAVEVRHLGWFDSENNMKLNEILTRMNMARVIIDTRPIRNLRGDKILSGTVYERMLAARERKPDVPVIPENTASFSFIRYIGHPTFAENTGYIDEWSKYLIPLLEDQCEVFVFCHSPDERLDPWLCRQFHQVISQQVHLSPLPWDELDHNSPRQERLL